MDIPSTSSTSSNNITGILVESTKILLKESVTNESLNQKEQEQQKIDSNCISLKGDSNSAEVDPTMAQDPRIIVNLLALERSTIPSGDYFRLVQRDIQPFMRKVVTTWMLEVCDEQRCEEQIFPLAINYMDRFLSICPISRSQFQLLGAVCLLLATKIRQCYALTTDLLCAYTDYSVTPDEIRNWELLLLATLQWNLSGITGFDFIDHILERVSWGRENQHIRQHAHTLVSVCYTETIFMQIPPSLLATACICAATRGINSPSSKYALRDVCRLTQSDPLEVEFTIRHIENVVAKETAAIQKQQQQQHLQQEQQQHMLQQQQLKEHQLNHHHHHHHQQEKHQQQQQQQHQQHQTLVAISAVSAAVVAAANQAILLKQKQFTTSPSASSDSGIDECDMSEPVTPTDVQDVYF